MNGIMGISELLSETKLDPAARHCVKSIRVLGCGANLVAIINDILDMSKIEGGLLGSREETMKIHPLVTRTVDSFNGLFTG